MKSETKPAPKKSGAKKTANGKTAGGSPLTDDQIIERATNWARLHENPKTRDQMDTIIDGLSAADQRRVYLCGQRIRAGLKPRIAR